MISADGRQFVLSLDAFAPALLTRPERVMEVLLVPPERARAACAAPRPAPTKRRRRVQAEFWAADPHAPDPTREKPRSLGLEQLKKAEEVYALDIERDERHHLPVIQRPVTRGDCANVPRPCPFVSCQNNLYVSRTRSGAAKLAFPNREPWEMPRTESCVLDVAEKGTVTVKRVAKVLNMTEERVRQIFVVARRKIRAQRGELGEEEE